MGMDGIYSGLNISASGMRAERIRQNTISSNIANVETTRTDEGGPYRRQFVVYKADGKQQDTRILNREGGLSGVVTNDNHLPIPSSDFPRDERFFGNGVSIAEIREDSRPPRMVYDPSHPDADAKGYVAMPNINVVQEMTDMISASRAYEANVTAFNATKSMLTQATQL
jgi:flagellar basal-body rod protein FlgC